MSTHNVCFHGQIKKNVYLIPSVILNCGRNIKAFWLKIIPYLESCAGNNTK